MNNTESVIMKKKIVIGNWKMNLTVPESTILVEKLIKSLARVSNTEMVICPIFLDIYSASKELRGTNILLGAQNLFFVDEGAYTGEISPVQLANFVKYCIIGHSERRINFGENDKMVANKVASAVAHGITPIICIGDTLHEKRDGLSKVVVMSQLETALSYLTESEVSDIIIAYEPVWAISTSGGMVCEPVDAEKMAKDIRSLVSALYGKKAATDVRVLYGGSVKDSNAEGYAKIKNMDGALVGAASLDYNNFTKIVIAYDKLASSTRKESTK